VVSNLQPNAIHIVRPDLKAGTRKKISAIQTPAMAIGGGIMAIVGLVAGIFAGFSVGGIGGSILLAIPGAILYGGIGAIVVGIVLLMLRLIPAIFVLGAIGGIIFAFFYFLWGAGK
jgi:hypothetical protein